MCDRVCTVRGAAVRVGDGKACMAMYRVTFAQLLTSFSSSFLPVLSSRPFLPSFLLHKARAEFMEHDIRGGRIFPRAARHGANGDLRWVFRMLRQGLRGGPVKS